MVAIRQDVAVRRGDIDADWLARARSTGAVACDIETTGLDWRVDQVRTVQLATPDAIVIVQVAPGDHPYLLIELLEDSSVTKVFHHAPFDLRFLVATWRARPARIACTKVAAKIVEPGMEPEQYSLKPSLSRVLGVSIDKAQQVSDWSASDLSRAQLEYAANDVRYLVPLLAELRALAAERGVADLLEASFAYLPTRATLDTLGIGDVFDY
ncbi:ribonuclease D [Cellulomonas sp. HZM]|uniref:ribonuclease D n=1 Tax=Cellulomonas sp. HZM TaxID=1454010 RepID=UPI000690B688|nr:ribonuclease D [Cellulomonas sp. HZM]